MTNFHDVRDFHDVRSSLFCIADSKKGLPIPTAASFFHLTLRDLRLEISRRLERRQDLMNLQTTDSWAKLSGAS